MAVKSSSIQRTPLVEALQIVIHTLENTKEEKPLTLGDITNKTGLNPRTVRKTISLLEETRDFFGRKDVRIIKGGSRTLLQTEGKKIKMIDLPDDVQKLIIRTKYFPQPSRADEIQVHLYSRRAFDNKSAIFLEDSPLVRQLVRQERIERARGEERKFYLTDIGKMVALGALDIYPELGKITSNI